MKAKNTRDSNQLPNAKLLIVLVFVAILAVFVKEAFFKYYEIEKNQNFQGVQNQEEQIIEEEVSNQTETQEPKHCSSLYLEIEEMLDKMNHCIQSSDCEALILGGDYVEFGCFHFIHKKENAESILSKMDEYNEFCDKIINKCAPSPESVCVEGKCVVK